MEIILFYIFAKDEKIIQTRKGTFQALAGAKIEFEPGIGLTNIYLYVDADKNLALQLPEDCWMGPEVTKQVLDLMRSRLLSTRTKYSASGSFQSSLQPLD